MNIFGNPTDANGGFQSPAETTLDMNNYKIINLDTPINNKDGANKIYVDSAISTGLPLAFHTVITYIGIIILVHIKAAVI
jgi:hypothetical protein